HLIIPIVKNYTYVTSICPKQLILQEVIDMNFDIKQAIIDNISTNSNEHLGSVVVDAMQPKEEKMLPGLGVLFELIWEHSNTENKQRMIDSLQKRFKKTH